MCLDALHRKAEHVTADLDHTVTDRTTTCDIQFLDVLTRTLLHAPHGMIKLKINTFDYGPVNMGFFMVIAEPHQHTLCKRIVVSRGQMRSQNKAAASCRYRIKICIKYGLNSHPLLCGNSSLLIAEIPDEPCQDPVSPVQLVLTVVEPGHY